MPQILQEKFSVLKEKTAFLLDGLADHNLEILQKSPGDGAWSVIQVLNHLIMVEAASLNYVRKKILGIETVGPVGMTANFRLLALRAMMMGRVRFRAPVLLSNPTAKETLEEIKGKWDEERTRLGEFLDDYPEEHLTRAIYKHPIAGRISLVQMLDFFRYHQQHHEKQVKRILKAVA